MEHYDVLITYEIKNREIENLCLIKRELERRGYSVLVRSQYETFFSSDGLVDADLVVVPGFYRSRQQFYASSHTPRTERIVNMLWEQIFNTEDEDNPDFVASIKPWGRDAVHLAWGPHMQKRLIRDWGVKEDHAPITGHIALDFLRGPLRYYYDDRETVFARYDIPTDKRVHLFISSLAFADLDITVLKSYSATDDYSSSVTMAECAVKTRETLLDWFERVLEENPDDIIIYRPHPEEKECEALKAAAARQPRLRIISAESVKQWVLVCDKIYNWYSTSTAEVYGAGKGCSILRPVELPYEIDIKVLHEAEHIKTFEQFEKEFLRREQIMAVSEEMLKEYYTVDENRYSYELVCDVIERALKDDSFLLSSPLENPLAGGLFNTERLKNVIKRLVASSSTMNAIYRSKLFGGTRFRELLDNVYYVKQKLEKNHVSDEDINAIIERIDRAFSKAEQNTEKASAEE